MPATISIDDLTPEQRKQINKQLAQQPRDVDPEQITPTRRVPRIPTRRARSMTAHEVKSYAFRVCNVLADLTPAERARVLRQAEKLNRA